MAENTNNQNQASSNAFESIDLGTSKPASVPMETVEVTINAGELVSQYAKSFVKEAYRKAPLRAEQINLTADELVAYCKFLVERRVACVNGECNNFRKLKSLYIPAYVQYVLSQVGVVYKRQFGLRLVPVCADTEVITLEEAYQISEKIGMFEDDLQIVQDAMPREIEGNEDVMSTALIAGYVRSMKVVKHVASTYVTAFLDMKLKQEMAFSALYRVQYDDVNFIATALTTHRGLY